GRRLRPAEALAAPIAAADAVVLRLPAVDPLAVLASLAPCLARPIAATTVERAAVTSRMFEAWMTTARRNERAAARLESRHEEPAEASIDAALQVWTARAGCVVHTLGRIAVQRLLWGDAADSTGSPWAQVPRYIPHARLALAALEPEHAAIRVYEGLTQALLAGMGRGTARHA